MEDCIFCKIVRGEMPSFKIYEDDTYLAFMDIYPRVKGHALVIPKKHYRWVVDIPSFGAYWEVVRKVANGVQKAIEASFITFVTLGDEVPHAHVHILPQMGGGIQGLKFGPVFEMDQDKLKELADKIHSTI